jgi:hypothetical protein
MFVERTPGQAATRDWTSGIGAAVVEVPFNRTREGGALSELNFTGANLLTLHLRTKLHQGCASMVMAKNIAAALKTTGSDSINPLVRAR